MCLFPIVGWRSIKRGDSGKRGIVFKKSEGYADMPIEIACGSCYECRLQKARNWAMRCTHEASMWEDNCFVTLTYDDENLPKHGSLKADHLSKFLKDLRQWYRYRIKLGGHEVNDKNRIRFFGAGEYGDKNCRPHYHVLLFNFDFLDKKRYTVRKGYQVYESQLLETIWGKGRSEVGSVTYSSAGYCARYIMKKYTNKDPDLVKEHYGKLEPEFSRMSRRPGIGKDWFDKFGDGVYKHDSIIVNGKEVTPPKYYDQLFENVSPKRLACVKSRRKNAINYEQERGTRVAARYKIAKAREELFTGGEL